MGGLAKVMEYLSRCTHRSVIGNERSRAISADAVAFAVRADEQGAKRSVRMPGTEFVRRFLSHVLPSGVKRFRHYAVLAAACKARKLEQACQASQLPQSDPKAIESAKDFMARWQR